MDDANMNQVAPSGEAPATAPAAPAAADSPADAPAASESVPAAAAAGSPGQDASLEQMTIALRVLEGKEKLSALFTHLAATNNPLHDAMVADAVEYLAQAKLLPVLTVAAPPVAEAKVPEAPASLPAPEKDTLGQVKSDPYIPGPRTRGVRIAT